MKSSLILEQIPEIFDSLTTRPAEAYTRIAQRQAKDYFDPSDGEAILSTKVRSWHSRMKRESHAIKSY